MAKGKSSSKIRQKGGNYDGGDMHTCNNNSVILIIVLFILAVGGIFMYFKYYDKQPQVIIVEKPVVKEKEDMTIVSNPVSEVQYMVDKEQERLINPLLPPERSYVLTNGAGIPVYRNSINVPTRGFTGAFQQIGLLYKKDPSGENNSEGNILPLFGRPTNTSRDKWYYYTTSDKFHSLKIPLKIKGRLCNDEWGCNELYDDDTVEVGPYNGQFSVQIYGYDSPKYLPVLP